MVNRRQGYRTGRTILDRVLYGTDGSVSLCYRQCDRHVARAAKGRPLFMAMVAGLGAISTSPTYPLALNLPLGAVTAIWKGNQGERGN
jgi:hypothetical protein